MYMHTTTPGADGKEKLKEKGITHVLSIHDTAEPQHPDVCLVTLGEVASILWLGRSLHYFDFNPFYDSCNFLYTGFYI